MFTLVHLTQIGTLELIFGYENQIPTNYFACQLVSINNKNIAASAIQNNDSAKQQ